MRLMLKAGLRASEATALRPEHIDLMSGKLTVREGKGAKDRTLWVREEVKAGASSEEAPALFLGTSGRDERAGRPDADACTS